MKEVNVTELRRNLPGYLTKVQRGDRIRVTSRGKAVAELAPPASSPANELDCCVNDYDSGKAPPSMAASATCRRSATVLAVSRLVKRFRAAR